MELNRVIRDCDKKEILTPRQRAVSVRLLAAGGRLHDVVANEAKQFVDLDIWRGSGCDRPGLLFYFVMSASSAILDALPRHDAIGRLQKRLPHANAGGCFAYHPEPSFQADAQHGAPNVVP